MTYPDFKNTVLSEVTDRYADLAEVSLTQVKKNNGIERCGLVIHEDSYGLSPTIYLEDFYEQLCGGLSYDEVLARILDTYEQYKRPIGTIADDFSNFSWVKEHLVFRLLSQKDNEEMLKDLPFVPFLDLALCFAVRVRVKSGVYGSALVHKCHADAWNTDVDGLFSYTKMSSPALLPAVCRRLDDVISEAYGDMCLPMPGMDDFPVYILTNKEKSYGASVICYQGVVKSLAEKLGSDLYLIPSSIHEFIAVPADMSLDIKGLDSTIHYVNENSIMPPEILSDHTYIYHRDADRITC